MHVLELWSGPIHVFRANLWKFWEFVTIILLCSVSEIYLNFSCSYTFVLLLRPPKVNLLVLLWAEAGILKQCERQPLPQGFFLKNWGKSPGDEVVDEVVRKEYLNAHHLMTSTYELCVESTFISYTMFSKAKYLKVQEPIWWAPEKYRCHMTWLTCFTCPRGSLGPLIHAYGHFLVREIFL